ncbi:MAG: serine acetyltransferase [Alphaproteobacteria bacterium]|nr:serine acetyltransferase [Alphaproteobacteria bacterium]
MLDKLKADLDAIIERDPAAGHRLAAVFLYPSFHVMLAHRMAHPLWRVGLRFVPRFIMQVARWFTGIEIHPAAQIGAGFFADHGMGVVIGETSIVGKNVTLYHDVTLGGVMPAVDSKAQKTIKRHPTIADDVIIGAGAQILGPVTVGKSARIGGNSVVTRDVGEGQTVVGIPAKAIKQASRDSQFEAYGVNDMPADDAQSRTIAALFAELETLRARINAVASEGAIENEARHNPSTSDEPASSDIQNRPPK